MYNEVVEVRSHNEMTKLSQFDYEVLAANVLDNEHEAMKHIKDYDQRRVAILAAGINFVSYAEMYGCDEDTLKAQVMRQGF